MLSFHLGHKNCRYVPKWQQQALIGMAGCTTSKPKSKSKPKPSHAGAKTSPAHSTNHAVTGNAKEGGDLRTSDRLCCSTCPAWRACAVRREARVRRSTTVSCSNTASCPGASWHARAITPSILSSKYLLAMCSQTCVQSGNRCVRVCLLHDISQASRLQTTIAFVRCINSL
jgi:hypothetical protein